MLECAEKLGSRDAKEGATVPPAEFCTGTKSAEALRQAWLMGFYSANHQDERPLAAEENL